MGTLTIKPNGQTLKLTSVTRPDTTTLTIYTDSAMSASASLPATVTSDTTYYLVDGPALVTVTQVDGTTLFSGQVDTQAGGGTTPILEPLPTIAQLAVDTGTAEISKATLTAKGGLISASAASTPVMLAVGTNDQVLTAASGETTGLAWATPDIRNETWTAKGGLISASATSVPVMLAVGSDDTILVADASEATGLAWKSIPLATSLSTAEATLVGGSATVADTSVTENTQIVVWPKTLGGTPGALYISAVSASTSFEIKSTSGSDTSTVVYQVLDY